MKKLSIIMVVLGMLYTASCALAPTSETTNPPEILVLYSGNTLGELKPCGCDKEEEQGGFERRMTFFQQARKSAKNTLVLDTGDNFHEPTRQGKIKARYLMKALARMEYDAVLPGEKDLVYGLDFISGQQGIPWLSSNIEHNGLSLPKERIKRFSNGKTAVVLAVADPGMFYGLEHSGSHVYDPVETVIQRVRHLHETGRPPDLVVLLTHMQREQALGFLEVEGVDIIVNGHIEDQNDKIDMKPVRQENRIFLQSGPLGQKMGEVRVQFGKDGKKTFKHRMVRLDSSVKFNAEMVKLYEQYNQEVEAVFFETLAARRSKNHGHAFAGDTTCQACHPAEHEIWNRSRHARAYETLKKANKAFDPECLTCHVMGFNQAGGFISEIDTPTLKNVQCEMCHGSGLAHSKSPEPGFGGQANEACKNCHVRKHSPRFDFSKYWPKISH